MATFADLEKRVDALPREHLAEHEYRRGYRDGWIQAANAMLDLKWLKTLGRIYDLLDQHSDKALFDWAIGSGDWSAEVWAPSVIPTCVYCGREATVLDHVLPRALGGTDDPANLAYCCYDCNMAKKAMHPDEWRATLERRGRQ